MSFAIPKDGCTQRYLLLGDFHLGGCFPISVADFMVRPSRCQTSSKPGWMTHHENAQSKNESIMSCPTLSDFTAGPPRLALSNTMRGGPWVGSDTRATTKSLNREHWQVTVQSYDSLKIVDGYHQG